MPLNPNHPFRVCTGQGKLEKVGEFEWSAEVMENTLIGTVREKSKEIHLHPLLSSGVYSFLSMFYCIVFTVLVHL